MGTSKKPVSVISYVGGKSQLVPNIVPIIEFAAREYGLSDYYELCGGGARMLLNLPPNLFERRVYNDMDRGLCNLFACLGDKNYLYELMALLEEQGVGEDVFLKAKHAREYEARMLLNGSDFELDRVTSAAYAYIVTQQSRAAMMTKFDMSRVTDKGRLQSYFKRVRNIDRNYSIFSGVEITCGDVFEWLDLLRGKNNGFVYLDPPYIPDSSMVLTEHYGGNSWLVADHERLVDKLLDIGDIKVALSGYNNECYSRLENAGWRKLYLKEVHVSSSAVGRKNTEFLWISFSLPKSLEEQVCMIDYTAW
ncbi:DNA adenine methylase [Paenibacillus sp. M1]|uniref:site-specific DNA-methyltransferase (adenine-specific) n=1 Tax=Paenibacillus haidiansis TaxID=1574488 RepID=A0ABU7VZB0_9BACL